MSKGTKCLDETKENLNNLRVLIDEGVEIIPFIGAGISIPFDLGDWKGLIEKIASRFEAKHLDAYSQCHSFLKNHDYEMASQILHSANEELFDNALVSAVIKRFDARKLNQTHKLIAKLARRVVITTNFDRCLEFIFEEYQRQFDRILPIGKKLFVTDISSPRYISIVKLHGDPTDVKRMVFTKDQYDDAYGLLKDPATMSVELDHSKRIPILFQSLSLTNAILFIGCSLEKDRTLSVLEHLHKNFEDMHLYAVLQEPKYDPKNPGKYERQLSQKREALKKSGIKPLWYSHKNHKEIPTLLEPIANSISKNNPKISETSKAISSYIAESVDRDGVIRQTCTPREYSVYAKKMSSSSRFDLSVWSLNGSPLDPARFDGGALRSGFDDYFDKIHAGDKFRIVIFKNRNQARAYCKIKPCRSGTKEEVRKYNFEFDDSGDKKNILYTTQNRARRGTGQMFDFGILAFATATADAILFFSPFNSQDFAPGPRDRNVKELVSCRANRRQVLDKHNWSEGVIVTLEYLHDLFLALKDGKIDFEESARLGVFDDPRVLL